MALTKNIVVEIGRIAPPYYQIHVKTITQIVEDGVVISSSNHRHVCEPDHEDISDQPKIVQDAAKVYWTDEVKQMWADLKDEQKSGGNYI